MFRTVVSEVLVSAEYMQSRPCRTYVRAEWYIVVYTGLYSRVAQKNVSILVILDTP